VELSDSEELYHGPKRQAMAAAAPRMPMQQSDFKRPAQHTIFDVRLLIDFERDSSHYLL